MAASLTAGDVLGAPLPTIEVALDQISFLDFARQIGTAFQVCANGGPNIDFWLVEARRTETISHTTTRAEDALNEKFRLLFAYRGDAPCPWQHGVFAHKRLGRFPLFVSAVGPPEPGARYYEACFNRPRMSNLM
jgi:hypothetical protein